MKHDINQKFTLGEVLTAEQLSFYDEYGFVHFTNFLSKAEIEYLINAIHDLEMVWMKNNVKKVNGIPIKYGKDEHGLKIIQRFAFASQDSEELHQFLQDKRFEVLKGFVSKKSRIGEYEKDGMVISHYVNTGASKHTKLGWHTDGLRDLLSGFHIDPMINVGISLLDSPKIKGGLRVIPRTHRQNFYDLLFRKKHFIDNTADPEEFAIETKAGDLTIHHGRVWHRAAPAEVLGAESKRLMIYFPIFKGKYKPKSASSRTPIYHKFQKMVR